MHNAQLLHSTEQQNVRRVKLGPSDEIRFSVSPFTVKVPYKVYFLKHW